MNIRRAALVAVVILLAACSVTVEQSPSGPLNFRQGYADGCNSGYKEAGHPYVVPARDWTAYQNDQLYKQGWDEGRQACFARYNKL
jgi:hypothetical protein